MYETSTSPDRTLEMATVSIAGVSDVVGVSEVVSEVPASEVIDVVGLVQETIKIPHPKSTANDFLFI